MLASGSGQGLGVDAKGTTNLPTLALSHMSSGGIGIGGSVKAEAISDEDRAILQDDFLDNL